MFIESEVTEVVVVGAGPTGLTVAIELARRGVPHRLLEMSPGPFTGSRGKGLQPRTLEVLDDLGVIDRFLAAGALYPVLRVHRPDGEELDWRMDELHEATPDVPYPNTWMVPQWRTVALLEERLAELGGRVERGAEVTGLTQDDAGVTVTLGSGAVITARYLVGADGGRSTIRRALGVGFEGETYETQRMLVADVRVEGLDRGSWHVWPGSQLGLCPLPGTPDFQFTAPLTGDEPEPTPASIQALLPDGITVTELGWHSNYRANMRMVTQYRSGNVFLAGDAAHVHSPAGGQGLNTGIQDAYNLGWKLATRDDALLDTYEAERLPVAAAVLGISTRLHQRAAAGAEDAMRRDDPALHQLSLNYRGGPLAVELRPEPGAVQAGDRAPNGGGMFDQLRGPHPTLLAFDAPGVTVPGVPVVHVTSAEAFRSYGIDSPTLLLIRPDNYIGCAAPAADPAAIATYLRRISPAQVTA